MMPVMKQRVPCKERYRISIVLAFSCELANMIRMPKARFRRRSTHVPNLTEFGSTLERHWRDI